MKIKKEKTSDINIEDPIFDLSQNLPDEMKQKLFSFIMNRYKVMTSYRETLDVKVRGWENIYNMKTAPKEHNWQSNLFVPYAYSIIQTILPKITAALYGNDNYLSVTARTADLIHTENKIASYLQQKIDIIKLKEKSKLIILAALKYPYAVTKTLWKYNVDNFVMKKQIKIANKYLTLSKKRKSVITYDDPEVELIDWFDFWIDPDALTIENARDCIHRSVKSFDYLKQMEKMGIYNNIDDLKNSVLAENTYSREKNNDTNKGYSEIELLEYWGQYDINGDGKDEYIVVTIANREKIIRIRTNDLYYHKKPFTQYKLLPEPFAFEGKSMIEILESLQNELNDIRNQKMDNTNLQLKKLFKVYKDGEIDISQIFSGPGNVMFLEDMNDVQEFKISDTTASIVQAEPMLKEDMQQVSGALDFTNKTYNNTATGISIITGEMATRFRQMVSNLADNFVSQFYLVFMFLKQFKNNDEPVRIYEKGSTVFQKVTLKELENNYFFKINIKDLTVNKQLKQQQWINLLNIVGRFDFVNVKELVKSTLDVFETKNIDKILDYNTYQQEVGNLQKIKLLQELQLQKIQTDFQQQMQLELQQKQQQEQQAQALIEQAAQQQAAQQQGIQEQMTPDELNIIQELLKKNQSNPIKKIQDIGTLTSPVNPTLKEPIQDIPQLDALKQEAGLNAG